MQDHRKLRVWRHAHDLALAVRQACRSFPRTGYAPLHSQITRSAESVLFNIVEGCGTSTQRDFARFLDSSIKSTLELESQLELARDYKIMNDATWKRLTTHTVNARRMLWGLRAKVLSSPDPNQSTSKPARAEQQAGKAQPRTSTKTPTHQTPLPETHDTQQETPNAVTRSHT